MAPSPPERPDPVLHARSAAELIDAGPPLVEWVDPAAPVGAVTPVATPSAAVAPEPSLAARVLALALLAVVLGTAMLHRDGAEGTTSVASTGSGEADTTPIALALGPVPPYEPFVWPTHETGSTEASSADADVCAPGSESTAALDEEAFARRFAAAGRRARERLASLLETSRDDRLRVLGLVLQRDAEVAAAASSEPISNERCGRDAACARRAEEARAEQARAAAAPTTDAIARLASASRDPLAYGFAVEACAGTMAAVAPACRLVSAEQWARLDSDNAVPWLHVAATAAARRDAAGLADALHRVAHARSNRLDAASVHDLLETSLPSDLGTAERVQVLSLAATAIASAWAVPDHGPALDYCQRSAVRDSNRAQTCDALAVQLTGKASTLLDLAAGIRLAEQIGWLDDRIENLRRRYDAYSRVQVEAMAEAEPTSCADLARAAEQSARLARLGEVGALRETVARSGKSIEQLAAEERASRPVRVAEQGARADGSN